MITKSEVLAANPHFPVRKALLSDGPYTALEILENTKLHEAHRLWIVFSLPHKIRPEIHWWFTWWCAREALLMLEDADEKVREGFRILSNGEDITKGEYMALFERTAKIGALASLGKGGADGDDMPAIIYNMAVKSSQKEKTLEIAENLYGVNRYYQGNNKKKMQWREMSPVEALVSAIKNY